MGLPSYQLPAWLAGRDLPDIVVVPCLALGVRFLDAEVGEIGRCADNQARRSWSWELDGGGGEVEREAGMPRISYRVSTSRYVMEG